MSRPPARRFRGLRHPAAAGLLAALVLGCGRATTSLPAIPPDPVPTARVEPTDGPAEAPGSDADAEAARRRRGEPPPSLLLPADHPLARIVSDTGTRLVRHAPRSVAASVRFHVLDVPTENAFAIGTGHIFVTRGLLALIEREAELANVLGHELAHVIAAHHLAREALPALYGRNLTTLATLAAYSREQERDADRRGQEIAERAGYDPTAMVRFLYSMDALVRLRTGAPRRATWLDTHPTATVRAAIASVRAGFSLEDPRTAAHDDERNAWLAHLDGLLLGENPAHGIERDGLFLHPALGFAVRFPAGWQIERRGTGVVAAAPGRRGVVALRRQGRGEDPVAAARAFAAAYGRHWANVRAEPTRVRGLPAFQVQALDLSPPSGHVLRGTWIAWEGWIYRIEARLAPAAVPDLRAAVAGFERGFRPLGPDALSRLVVVRLRLVPAREGETLAQLGARAASEWTPAEASVMNALPVSTPLSEGLLVKIARSEPWSEDPVEERPAPDPG